MAFASGACPFFVQGDSPSYATARLNLALYGSALSGVFAGLPLFLLNNSGDNRASGSVPFYALGGAAPVSGVLTLYVSGQSQSATASLDLFLAQSGASASLNLYASGQGQYAGAVPASASLPLFLARGEAEALYLFCQGPGTPASGALHLYAKGAYLASGVLDFVAPGKGAATASLDFCSSGW